MVLNLQEKSINRNLQSGVAEGDDPGGAPARDAAGRRVRAPAAAAAHLAAKLARSRRSLPFEFDAGRRFFFFVRGEEEELGRLVDFGGICTTRPLTARWGPAVCLYSPPHRTVAAVFCCVKAGCTVGQLDDHGRNRPNVRRLKDKIGFNNFYNFVPQFYIRHVHKF